MSSIEFLKSIGIGPGMFQDASRGKVNPTPRESVQNSKTSSTALKKSPDLLSRERNENNVNRFRFTLLNYFINNVHHHHHHHHGIHLLKTPSPFSKHLSSISLSMASHTPQATQTVSPGEIDSEDDVSQLIQSHQKVAARLPPVEEIRTFLDLSVRATLSTFSQVIAILKASLGKSKYEGYPSGSMVDFACDSDGTPILAMSSLAVHTKDILANPRCSLLVARDPEDRTDLTITIHGDATVVSEKDTSAVRAAYLKRHPNAFWVDFGDFQFLRIEPKVVRYVSGVATALLQSGEFDKETYQTAKVDPISQFSTPVATHMNKDHSEDTKAIVQHSTKVPVDFAYMLDMDSLGFYAKAGYQGNNLKLRIPFPRRAVDRKDVKNLIVEMLQAAKAST